jgi:hypothetical protein
MEAHGGGGERTYSSYSFSTSALDGGEWSASRPGCALPPGKGPPVPIGQEAGLEEKSSASVGDRTPIVQPAVRHYTAWATAAPVHIDNLFFFRNCLFLLLCCTNLAVICTDLFFFYAIHITLYPLYLRKYMLYENVLVYSVQVGQPVFSVTIYSPICRIAYITYLVLSAYVSSYFVRIIQGYSKRSIHFQKFILQVLLNNGDMLYFDWRENSQNYFHTLQVLDVSPTCDAQM